MNGCSISDLTRSIRMHARYAEGGFAGYLKISQHLIRGVQATGITPDLDYLRRLYHEAASEISAEGMQAMVVPLGNDPFGDGAREDAERAQRRENFAETEDRLAGRPRRGTPDFPNDLTGGAFDHAPTPESVAPRATRSRRAPTKQKAVRHA